MKHSKHVSLANPVVFLQAIFGMAAVMMILLTYDFIKLPSPESKGLEMSELRAMMAKQDQHMNSLHEDMQRVVQQEQSVASKVDQIERDDQAILESLHIGQGQNNHQSPQSLNRPFLFKDEKAASVKPSHLSNFKPRDFSQKYTQPTTPQGQGGGSADGSGGEGRKEIVPDMRVYVKKLSIFDDRGCSSGQRWEAGKGECLFMPQLERRPSISPDEFMDYFKAGRAVILTNFTDDWKAFQNWVPEKLKARYGSETVNIQKGRSQRKNFETEQHLLRRDVKFGEFIDNVMSNTGDNDIYLTANNNLLHRPQMRDLLKDMEPFYPGFLSVDPTQTHFWFGPGGTKTPLHYDPISLFHTHVKGRKLWRLWPPEMGPYLYHREKVYSEVDFYNPDHKKFPLYKYAHMIEEIIEPGQSLFVPTGWWHTVDALDTPTISLSATSWLARFYSHENKLRAKWPMKVPHPPSSSASPGPATPGEKTPLDFDLHLWAQTLAKKHQKMPDLPATLLSWDATLNTKDMEDFRKALDKYPEEGGVRVEAVMFMLLNPLCSQMSFDWQAWVMENVGLKNQLPGILQVLGKDGDTACMHQMQETFKQCLERGASLWDDKAVEESAEKHRGMLKQVRDNQRQLNQKNLNNNQAKKNWASIRHVNGWKPPSEFQIQNALSFPGAELLSARPRSVVVRGMLTPEQCDELIAQATPNLIRSAVIGAENDAGKVSDVRTSMGAWLLTNKGAVATLEQKTAQLTGFDESHQEGVHVLRYLEGETYNRHLDACDTGAPDKSINPECERFLRRSGDRVASLVIMLQQPEKGGATAFPRVKVKKDGSADFNMNYAGSCDDPNTLQTTLHKGDAVMFWSYSPEEENPDGLIDWASEHTGCKVEQGIKWIATIWTRGSSWRGMPKYQNT
mmetsp:Transcript_17812/g.24644  ORF Transcript_17812/g.24644 Transcript_17812/m.24644 type:complete len:903 (+) Transcript_17812:137-2845(+)|eukprot:CAMPEP_0196581026 /NCGR_PEP_ID=MMETSP1081-20130531/31988_1 /TAXON_ID=36882 /ORGANISM="Pyramimonas amylifera, Strain CCMP720" /LENGTH=902 /DNA_ID=CAMNT_0041901105 /DNA_START=131 /DNA_END=2839 /DNA_ORIENTATION=+